MPNDDTIPICLHHGSRGATRDTCDHARDEPAKPYWQKWGQGLPTWQRVKTAGGDWRDPMHRALAAWLTSNCFRKEVTSTCINHSKKKIRTSCWWDRPSQQKGCIFMILMVEERKAIVTFLWCEVATQSVAASQKEGQYSLDSTGSIAGEHSKSAQFVRSKRRCSGDDPHHDSIF